MLLVALSSHFALINDSRFFIDSLVFAKKRLYRREKDNNTIRDNENRPLAQNTQIPVSDSLDPRHAYMFQYTLLGPSSPRAKRRVHFHPYTGSYLPAKEIHNHGLSSFLHCDLHTFNQSESMMSEPSWSVTSVSKTTPLALFSCCFFPVFFSCSWI